MSSKNSRHVHKYYRAKSPYSSIGYLWACALPNCSHHMPEHYASMLPGKFTICWKCGESTTLDGRTLMMDKPLCADCDPNALSMDDAVETIAEILGKVNKDE